jgi:hypothetical protein
MEGKVSSFLLKIKKLFAQLNISLLPINVKFLSSSRKHRFTLLSKGDKKEMRGKKKK